MFKKTKPSDPLRTKASSRLSRLSDNEILNWSDQVGTGIVRAMDDYRRTKDPVALEEALQGLSTMQGAVDVLLLRN